MATHLPVLLAPGSIPGWVLRGLCRHEDPDLFFPQTKRADQAERAVEVCVQCPVMVECLAYALKHRPQGVWGGTTEEDRRRMGAPPTTSRPRA